jgi:ankyrin repeat protein
MLKQPYMTPIEILRVIAVAIDSKGSNKQLDDNVFKYDYLYTLTDKLINDVISAPIASYINPRLANRFRVELSQFTKDYLAIVNTISLDGITRENTEPVFTKFSIDNIIRIFHSFMIEIKGPDFLAVRSIKTSALEYAFNWLEKNIEWWGSFYSQIDKDNRYRIKLWKQNDEIPDLFTIHQIPDLLAKSPIEDKDWQNIKSIILFARFLDLAKRDKSHLYAGEISAGDLMTTHDVKSLLYKFKDQNQGWLKPLGQKGLEIDYVLFKKNQYEYVDNESRKSISQELIVNLNKSAYQLDKFNGDYWLSWYEARWNAFSGDLLTANKLYKQTFAQALYFSGPSLITIISEALAVAASKLPKPDKPFIKRLKNSAIMFDIDIPLHRDDISNLDGNKFDTVAEDWEIDMYKASFNKQFPTKYQFEYSKAVEFERVGPLMVDDEVNIEPNYRYPNVKFAIGETWQKTMPQIVYFSWFNNVDVVKKLVATKLKQKVKERINVNELSDTNESALLFSILQLDVLDLSANMDDRLFHILSKEAYEKDVIDAKTPKKKLRPLVCAVDTGRIDVVSKVIEMGADLNLRGYSDNQSPLFLALSRIGIIKRPDIFLKLVDAPPITPELLDTIRRHSNGFMGVTLSDVERSYTHQLNDPLYTRFIDSVFRLLVKNIKKHMPIKNMRKIAKMLIEGSGDPNAIHKTRINGFTPLMLAAELDEVELFIDMINSNGNPFITCQNPSNGMAINCFHIALLNKSQWVLKYLFDNQLHLKQKFGVI